MHLNAVIVAAGRGTRVGAHASKILTPVAGQPLILRTLECFSRAEEVDKTILVVPNERVAEYESLLRLSRLSGLTVIVRPGGLRRQDSVRAGLEALDPDCEMVVIHDGARPFAGSELVDRCVRASKLHGSVIAAVPARNTIKLARDGQVKETLSRQHLWEVQTPQVFPVQVLREAHEKAELEGVEATDDAMLVERLDIPVWIVEGGVTNFKITFPEDFLFAEALVAHGLV